MLQRLSRSFFLPITLVPMLSDAFTGSSFHRNHEVRADVTLNESQALNSIRTTHWKVYAICNLAHTCHN